MKKQSFKVLLSAIMVVLLVQGCEPDQNLEMPQVSLEERGTTNLEQFIAQNEPVDFSRMKTISGRVVTEVTAYYMNNYGSGVWNKIAGFPNAEEAIGVAGENTSGAILAGVTGLRHVYIRPNYNINQWYKLPDAPFDIKGIAGDNAYGVVIYGGVDNRQVAYLNNYTTNLWNVVSTAPFPISGIAGNNRKGPTIFGGATTPSQISFMPSYASNNWTNSFTLTKPIKETTEWTGSDFCNPPALYMAVLYSDNTIGNLKLLPTKSNWCLGQSSILIDNEVIINSPLTNTKHIAGNANLTGGFTWKRNSIVISGGISSREIRATACTNYSFPLTNNCLNNPVWTVLNSIPVDIGNSVGLDGNNVNGVIISGNRD